MEPVRRNVTPNVAVHYCKIAKGDFMGMKHGNSGLLTRKKKKTVTCEYHSAGSHAVNWCGYEWAGETRGTCWPSNEGRRARHIAEPLTGCLTEVLSCQRSSISEVTADAIVHVCVGEKQELC